MKASASGESGETHDRRSDRPSRSDDGSSWLAPDRSSGSRDSVVGEIMDEGIFRISTDIAYLLPVNGDINGITRFTITPVGLEDERNYFGVHVGGGWVDFSGDSLADRAVRSANILEVGVRYRRYTNDPHVFLSPYVAGGLAWESLLWRYRTPVVSDGDTISSDSLSGLNAYTGVGVALRRAKRVSLFGEAGLGGMLHRQTTKEGFRNDVFDNYGYVSFTVGLTARF